MEAPATIDAYIAQFSPELQEICQRVRQAIRTAAPDAKEKIGYGIPTYYQRKNLIHFSIAKKHLGIYPGPDAIAAFADRLTTYKTSKGTIQLPLAPPIDYELISDITHYCVQRENAGKA